MPTVDGAALPFAEAIDYFRSKVNVTTERWNSLQGEAHDIAFTTAGATSAQLLQDIRTEVDRAIAQGTAFEEFKRNFGTIVERYGWDHRGGREWRALLIYRQNLYQSYAAGRYEQQTDPDLLRRRPYWRYRHGGSRVPRPTHLAHDGKVFPADSEFWNSWYPPSGYGCSCYTQALSQDDLERLGLEVEEPPAVGELMEVRDENNQLRQVVNRPDEGFDYAPGRVQRQGRQQEVLTEMLGRLDPDLRSQVQAFIAANPFDGSQTTTAPPPNLRKYLSELPDDQQRQAVRDWIEARATKAPKPVLLHGMTNEEPMRSVTWEGIRYHFPDNADTNSAITRTIYQLTQEPKLPSSLKKHTKEVYLSTQQNKEDSYWAVKYNRPNFRSAATGGDGKIVVYNGRSMRLSTLAHESGHSMAKARYGSHAPPTFSDFAAAVRAEPTPPTSYASVHIQEDFAESVKLYVLDKAAFRRSHPQRFAVIDRLIRDDNYGG